MDAPSIKVPSSILIVGSGVFGLSTAYALARREGWRNTKITLLERLDFPASDGSSIDSSRIIRADYADPAYSYLMAEAHEHWRSEFGANGRYTESGLCIVMDQDKDEVRDKDDEAYRYMANALQNVWRNLGLKMGKRDEGGQIEPLETEDDVNRVMRSMGGSCGQRGYVNWTAGWADAEAGVRYMRKLVESTGRVGFKTAEVKRLIYGSDRVESAELADGSSIEADLVILATGAWTPQFVDLRGIASATGQILAYIDLTQAEQDRLGSNPTLLCESNGMFIIQPRDRVLKVARHGFGYANFVTIPHPERPDSGESVTVSLPRTKHDDPKMEIPAEGMKASRDYLSKTIPDLKDRPWSHTRVCWYTDTPKGDWLIDYHPTYSNLFLLTGGSGHGYKFLPVLGDRVADVIERHDRDDLGAELRKKWAWPKENFKDDHIWTDDWRGGKKGMILDEELAKPYDG